MVATPDLSLTPKSIEAVELTSPSAQLGSNNNDIYPLPSEDTSTHGSGRAIDGGGKADAEVHHDGGDPDRRSDQDTPLRPSRGHDHGKCSLPIFIFDSLCFRPSWTRKRRSSSRRTLNGSNGYDG